MGLRERAERLKLDIPAVFLALKHKNTPFAAKLFAAMAVGYALSPVDLIPDFIPVIGYLDDLLLLPLLVALAVKRIPPPVFAQCRKEAETLWRDGKPKKWLYAIPIFVFWGAVFALLLWAVIPR